MVGVWAILYAEAEPFREDRGVNCEVSEQVKPIGATGALYEVDGGGCPEVARTTPVDLSFAFFTNE